MPPASVGLVAQASHRPTSAVRHPDTRWPIAWLALFVVVLVAYAPVYRAGFIWDDDDYVIENVALRTTAGLWRIWFDPSATPQYYPLVHTTFWIEYHIWGLWPAGYHVTNVLLHALNACLLWKIFSFVRVPTAAAWLAAAIFAVHPVHVESVAWITERKNVLSAAFGLGALLGACHFFGLDTQRTESAAPGHRDWRIYAVATFLFAAALLSKTVLCSLPVVIWLLIWWQRGSLQGVEILMLIPWLAIGAASGLLTAWLEKMHVGATGGPFDLTAFARMVIAGRATWFYWLKLLWPHPLIFMYPRWNPLAFSWLDLVYPVAIVVVLVALWAAMPRVGRGPLAAVLCFLVTAFPALGFISVYPMRYTFVADHYQYLASVGPLLLAAAALWRMTGNTERVPHESRLRRFRWTSAAVLLTLAALTARQTTIYHSVETLWTDTVAKNPRCSAAYFHLGKVRMSQGRYAEAASLFARHQLLEIDHSEDDISETLLGNALVRDGRPTEAVPHFEKALSLNPVNVEALNGLANTLARSGQAEQAVSLYRRALAQRADDPSILMNLANALAVTNAVDEAITSYESAVAVSPADATIRINCATAYARRGRYEEAIRHLREAVRLEPTNAMAHELLNRVEADRQKQSR